MLESPEGHGIVNSLLSYPIHHSPVAFRIYDIDQDGFISNGELFQVLKTMVGNNLTEKQLQEIVDKTILYADKDGDGKISFQEFCDVSVGERERESIIVSLLS